MNAGPVQSSVRMRRALVTTIITLTISAVAALGAQRRGTPPLTLDSIAGEDSFRFYCSSCHGPSGKGDGPMATALKTRPADLTALARLNGGTFPRDRVRATLVGERLVPAHGSTEMPVWGVIFSALDPVDARVRVRIDNLVAHVESLQAPSSGPGELGARLFRSHCAVCHGATGRGDGPLADQLRQSPPDLTGFTEQSGGVFPSDRVYRIIDGREILSHGNREMPVWGEAFRGAPDGLTANEAKARIEAIVRYLRVIQRRSADILPLP